MNEGPMSTMLGLKGIPALAEELMVARNIALAEYAETPVHFMAISTAKSVELIREAKAKGLQVTAAVHAYNICWNDEMLSEFDTNYKVNPPLRSEADRVALLNAVADGTIDCITSGHKPEDVESKVVEFDLAAFGITGLETCYSLSNMSDVLTQEQLIRALAINPRRIAGVAIPVIKEGEKAELTAFDPKASWTYSRTKSLSKNTPLLGKNVNGGIVATFC
jgi:dihydroorotase